MDQEDGGKINRRQGHVDDQQHNRAGDKGSHLLQTPQAVGIATFADAGAVDHAGQNRTANHRFKSCCEPG